MKLFHSTDAEVKTLQPTIGGSRHAGEDERAVGKPLVWLSNQPEHRRVRREDGNMRPDLFRYEVEVDENDPALHVDEEIARGVAALAKMSGDAGIGSLRWYFVEHAVDVVAAEKWDPVSRTFVPVIWDEQAHCYVAKSGE